MTSVLKVSDFADHARIWVWGRSLEKNILGFWSVDLMRIYEDLKEEKEEDYKYVQMGMHTERFWTILTWENY